MSIPLLLYRQAARFAEEADIAKAKRLPVDYRDLYERAFRLEKEAALALSQDDRYPMPRPDLISSAAALAFKAGNYLEAEKMIALGRSENPPANVAAELNSLENSIRQALAATATNGSLQVKGTLVEAKADEREIKIRDAETSKLHSFTVPAKMFKKIVKEYWQDVVSAVGKASSQGVFTLEKISPAN